MIVAFPWYLYLYIFSFHEYIPLREQIARNVLRKISKIYIICRLLNLPRELLMLLKSVILTVAVQL